MKEAIVKFISDQQNGCRTADVADALKVTVYQARYYLLQLEKEGRVNRTPIRRGAATLWQSGAPDS